jgi:hypothetical protein
MARKRKDPPAMGDRVLADIDRHFTRTDVRRAYLAGKKDRKNRRTIYACPFIDPRNIQVAVAWINGYYGLWKQ